MINNPFAEDGIIACQYCGSGEYLYNEDGNKNNFCGQCGAMINWMEADPIGWNNPEINVPLPRSDVFVKYGNEIIRCWYSSTGKWMEPDSILSWRVPDAWRYMTEKEKNGT